MIMRHGELSTISGQFSIMNNNFIRATASINYFITPDVSLPGHHRATSDKYLKRRVLIGAVSGGLGLTCSIIPYTRCDEWTMSGVCILDYKSNDIWIQYFYSIVIIIQQS